jgi:hypothetical protein
MIGRRHKALRDDESVAGNQMRTLRPALVGPRDVLPPTIGEESVVAAGDDLRAVLQRDAVGALHGPPVIADVGHRVAPVPTVTDGPVDTVSHSDVLDAARPAAGTACVHRKDLLSPSLLGERPLLVAATGAGPQLDLGAVGVLVHHRKAANRHTGKGGEDERQPHEQKIRVLGITVRKSCAPYDGRVRSGKVALSAVLATYSYR